ncbi:S53 family peptidase [Bradyrhizobium sp. Ash2021]|uniref:S53 family peptidase n=1 Tax=Bradyrhizobium sp. Ash2021 TaxID=2954771 RepID=UPI002815694D|nr:S53 family peptidase [Bradyrhizobium sp. Ash2021]WMT75195.1 S53 family peptidase [Bradyrhizobium sp. Ash2021]
MARKPSLQFATTSEQNSHENLRRVAGSERLPLPNARVIGPADPEQPIRLTVYVRSRPAHAHIPSLKEIGHSPYEWMHSTQSARVLSAFEADAKDINAVKKFATANKLKVIEASEVKRSVLIEGKIGDATRAFGVDLQIWEHPGGRYRGRVGPVHTPDSLRGIVEAVFGFDNRVMGRPYFRRSRHRFVSRAAQPLNYLPTEIADFYSFPDADGSGQTIAIFVFNGALGDSGQTAVGGYSQKLVKSYFKDTLHLAPPKLTDVVVHGPGNKPGDGSQDTDVTGEVLLDICMAGAVAPKAKFMMYFTEFTEQGWVDALTSAVTAMQNRPSIISISYGNPEDGPTGQILWTQQAIMKVNEALQRAALAGINVCVAAGDQGSTEEVTDQRQHVDYPASSPWVLACGGTRVVAANGVINRETVWNDGPSSATGGGVSSLFALPTYQTSANVPVSVNPGHRIGRGVPDVSGIADPDTGVLVMGPDGTVGGIGGTSATAPMWAGLIARLNQLLGTPLGFLNPILYKNLASGVLRDVSEGDNGAYRAGVGWDACTGLGSPNGTRILAALKGLVK